MDIKDKDLGIIKLLSSSRAKSITARMKDGYLRLTYPSYLRISDVERTIQEMKPRLLSLKEGDSGRVFFNAQTQFNTFSFTIEIKENTCSNYYMRLKDGILSITCPANTRYEDTEVQNAIRNAIEKTMRYEAKRVFPSKVKMMAHQHGFTFSEVKINKSRSRWGSCSSKQSINLSYYCTLLPEYLIDFIILHELCHTVEMNHGERFWHLLDKVSGGKAKALTQELKNIKTGW